MINEWEDFKKTVKPITKRGGSLDKSAIYERVEIKKNETEEKLITFDDDSKIFPKSFDLEKNLLKKIKKGRINIDKKLDLHGLGLLESEERVNEFIKECFEKQYRLILIITGKGPRLSVDEGWQGTGKLRKNLPDWLRKPYLARMIVWFGKAPRQKGGDGATVIYLKKVKE